MSVSTVKTRVILAVLMALIMMLAGASVGAADCEAEGGGGRGGFGCPDIPPDFDDKNEGDTDPRIDQPSEAELWKTYCVDRYPDYDGDPTTGPWDNDPKSLNDFYFDTSPLPEHEIEERNLNPTGEYVWVWAVCGGPEWERRRDQYGYGPGGANFENWVVATEEPVPLEEIRDRLIPGIEGMVEARLVRPGEMAPPADANVVNTKTWLWVENDFDQTERDQETQGQVTVWVEAVPTHTRFEARGEQLARCEGPGTPYTGGPLDAHTDCSFAGFDEPSPNAPFDGTVTIEWVFHWGMGDDYYGEFHTYDATTDLPWTVDEVFSTEIG